MNEFTHIIYFLFKRKLKSNIAIPLSFLFLASGCSTQNNHNNIIENGSFKTEIVETQSFNLFIAKKTLSLNSEATNIYIEGDGFSWINKNTPSDNPTPKKAVSLLLASKDNNSNIIYIARPCQIIPKRLMRNCKPHLWTTHRYSEEVISSIDEAITTLKNKGLIKGRINLIGYSGGGVVAALLSVRRNDIASLITIASNLDHSLWTKKHMVTPLFGSLSLLNDLDKLEAVPQAHLLGTDDRIVQQDVIDSVLTKYSYRKSVIMINNFDHSCCWEKAWPSLLNNVLNDIDE